MDKMNSEAKQLVKSAENKLNPGFLKSLISSKSSRLEEALDLLEKAGNIYKLNKNWTEAGETFYRCGEIEMELGADSANYFQDAAHCFSFVDIEKSNQALQKTLQIYTNQGRFQMAGKIQKQMAEKFEEDLEYDKAIEAYKSAADYFSMEKMNSKSYEQGCLIKYSDLLCIRNRKDSYPEAANIYEKIAMQYLSVPLLKGSSNDLFFKAVCVHLAWGEDTIADNKLKLFTTENPTMCDTREEIFLKAAISSVKNAEVEEFQEAVSQYKKFFDMDKWKINVFKAILDSIEKTQNKEYLD